jgi:four helix bundle protein
MLDHEQLDVYQCAIRFVALTVPIVEALPRSSAGLVDQLRRAAISIPLNIAEGSGRPHGADRARFRAIARGSALECAAVLDVCGALSLIDLKLIGEAKELLARIVAMLTKLCR